MAQIKRVSSRKLRISWEKRWPDALNNYAARKLLPALYGLWQGRFLPREFAVVGVGRRDKNDEAFREEVRTAVATFRGDSTVTADGWNGFLANAFYHRADFTTAEGMRGLARQLPRLEAERNLSGNRLFYLATDPDYFGPIVDGLAS